MITKLFQFSFHSRWLFSHFINIFSRVFISILLHISIWEMRRKLLHSSCIISSLRKCQSVPTSQRYVKYAWFVFTVYARYAINCPIHLLESRCLRATDSFLGVASLVSWSVSQHLHLATQSQVFICHFLHDSHSFSTFSYCDSGSTSARVFEFLNKFSHSKETVVLPGPGHSNLFRVVEEVNISAVSYELYCIVQARRFLQYIE